MMLAFNFIFHFSFYVSIYKDRYHWMMLFFFFLIQIQVLYFYILILFFFFFLQHISLRRHLSFNLHTIFFFFPPFIPQFLFWFFMLKAFYLNFIVNVTSLYIITFAPVAYIPFFIYLHISINTHERTLYTVDSG